MITLKKCSGYEHVTHEFDSEFCYIIFSYAEAKISGSAYNYIHVQTQKIQIIVCPKK